jgi:hypothetical protein
MNDRTIWKFTLAPGNAAGVSMPIGANILHVHEQHGDICLWAEVDSKAPYELRRIAIYGTGHEMPADPGAYIGSVHLANGRLVFHVYERGAT